MQALKKTIKTDEPQPLLSALNDLRESIQYPHRKLLMNHDLTLPQWRVILLLSKQNNVEIIELAKLTSLLQTSVSRILAALLKRDLITREANENDLRRFQISLSKKGWALFNEISPMAEGIFEQMNRLVGQQKVDELIQLLKEFNHVLTDEENNSDI